MVLVVDIRDNVAVALNDLPKDKEVKTEKQTISIKADIPFGHKVALTDIREGERIIKYGQVIGVATANIRAGSHVHTHNMVGLRGRGDINNEANRI